MLHSTARGSSDLPNVPRLLGSWAGVAQEAEATGAKVVAVVEVAAQVKAMAVAEVIAMAVAVAEPSDSKAMVAGMTILEGPGRRSEVKTALAVL